MRYPWPAVPLAKSPSAHPTVTAVPETLAVGVLPPGILSDFAAPGPLPWLDHAAQATSPPAENAAIAAAPISDRRRRQPPGRCRLTLLMAGLAGGRRCDPHR